MAIDMWEVARKYANPGGTAKNGTYGSFASGTPSQTYGPPRPSQTVGPPRTMIGDALTIDQNGNRINSNNQGSYQDRSNDLFQRAEQRLNQPTTPFQYNPYTDPQYQQALQAAQQGAATQQGNTLARLRSMGQGKSSYSEGVANQIGQQAVADVNARTLPQLMSQAYQRYRDEQNLARQNALDLLGLGREYNNLNQQGLDNDYRNRTFDRNVLESDRAFGEQRKQNNLDAALRVGQQLGRVIDPKEDYGLLFNQTDAPLNLQGQQFQYQQARDQIADEQYKEKFDEDVRRFGLNYAMEQAQLANQVKQQNTSNQLARDRFDFEKDQTTEKRSQSDAARTLQADVVAGLGEFDNPEEATRWLNANAAEITKQLGPEGYQSLLGLVPQYFGVDKNAAKTDSNIRQDAAKMAQEDNRWNFAKTQQEKNALVNEYVTILRGG